MSFSSDEALAAIPEELRLLMPELGFRRDRNGQFYFFPIPSRLRGAYDVPDEDLESLARTVQEQRGRLYAAISIAIPIVAFIAAFLLGAIWVENRPPPASSDRIVTMAVVGGSLAFSMISALSWARLSAARLARAQLAGMRFNHTAWLVHQPAEQPRMSLWALLFLASLVGLYLWLGYVLIIEVFTAARAGATGVAVYGTLSLLFYLALSGGLAALVLVWSFARWRPAHRFWTRFSPPWAPLSSWAGPSEATVATWQAGHEAAALAYGSRPLWRKLIVPAHLGRFGGVLTFLHRGLYLALVVALAIAATQFWKDRRPADAELLAFFTEVTAPPENDRGTARVIVKWTSDPAVHLRGGEGQREGEALEQVLQSLSRLTGLEWHRVSSPEAADILIEITYGEDAPGGPEGVDQGTVNYSFGEAGTMTGGKVTVADRGWYDNIFHWGLAEIAGLRGDSSVGDDSVTGGAGSFTALDRAALMLLYTAEIEPGLETEEANERARQIVAAWPETYTVDGLHEALKGLQ